MSRIYTLAEADALVPSLITVTERLRALRDEVVGLRDAYRERETLILEQLVDAAGGSLPGVAPEPGDPEAAAAPADPELGRLRLRLRGLVDQMQADVAWLDDREIVLRDIGTGLLDFPGEADGHEIWLCWRLGESAIRFCHGRDEGFAQRRPIDEAAP